MDDARRAAMNSKLFAEAQRHTGARHAFIGTSLGLHARMQCQLHGKTKLVSAFTAFQSASSAKDRPGSRGDDIAMAGADLVGREQAVMTIGRAYIVGAKGDTMSIAGHHPGYIISEYNPISPAVHARDAIACEVASVVASRYLDAVGRDARVPRVGFNEATVRNINACADVVLQHVLQLLFQPTSSSSNGQRAAGVEQNFCLEMGELLSRNSRGRSIGRDCLQVVELSSRASSAKLGGGTTPTRTAARGDAKPGDSPSCRVFSSSSSRCLSWWRRGEMDKLAECIGQANDGGLHPDWQGIKDTHFSGTTQRSANAIRAKYVSRSPSPLGCTLLVHYL